MNELAEKKAARAKALAWESGFPLSGLAAVPEDGRPPRAEAFASWLARGLHQPLDYLETTAAARLCVKERLPWARSVLCLAVPHNRRPLFLPAAPRPEGAPSAVGRSASASAAAAAPRSDRSAQPARPARSAPPVLSGGRVARHARGRDYHFVLERRLKRLARALRAAGVAERAHWYVDSGPVLERAWAAAAGLGWIGKNCCLTHPRYGSYLLLAELFLDAELPADAPRADGCGSCRACLDACPTGALRAPRELACRRCLSQWTLESGGRLPEELRAARGDRLAGCDACREACPYNKDEAGARARAGAETGAERPTADEELCRPLPWERLSLKELAALSREEYDAAFKRSVLRRVGLEGLRAGARELLRRCDNE